MQNGYVLNLNILSNQVLKNIFFKKQAMVNCMQRHFILCDFFLRNWEGELLIQTNGAFPHYVIFCSTASLYPVLVDTGFFLKNKKK